MQINVMMSVEKRIDKHELGLYNAWIMTVEFEQRDLLNRTTERHVVRPGTLIRIGEHSFMRPAKHVRVVSEDEIRVSKVFAGEILEEVKLERDGINKSSETYSYLGKYKISWKPTQTNQ